MFLIGKGIIAFFQSIKGLQKCTTPMGCSLKYRSALICILTKIIYYFFLGGSMLWGWYTMTSYWPDITLLWITFDYKLMFEISNTHWTFSNIKLNIHRNAIFDVKMLLKSLISKRRVFGYRGTVRKTTIRRWNPYSVWLRETKLEQITFPNEPEREKVCRQHTLFRLSYGFEISISGRWLLVSERILVLVLYRGHYGFEFRIVY